MPLSKITNNSFATSVATNPNSPAAFYSSSANTLVMKTSSVDRLIMNSSGAITQGNTSASMQVGNYTIASNTGPASSATNNWNAQFGNQTGAVAVLLGWKSYSGRSLAVIGAQGAVDPIVMQPDGGQIVKPSHSYFIAYPSATTTANPVAFNATEYNNNNNFNTATYGYTAPESGIYWFNLVLTYDGAGNFGGLVSLHVNGGRARDMYESIPTMSTNTEFHHGAQLYLTKGDVVTVGNPNNIEFQGGGAGNYYSLFSGYFLG